MSRNYKFYSEMLDAKFDTLKDLEAAEAECEAKERAKKLAIEAENKKKQEAADVKKQLLADIDKATNAVVAASEAYGKVRHEAYKVYQEATAKAIDSYHKAINEAKAAYDNTIGEKAGLCNEAKKQRQKLIDEFCAKYGYYHSTTTLNSDWISDVFNSLFNF